MYLSDKNKSYTIFAKKKKRKAVMLSEMGLQKYQYLFLKKYLSLVRCWYSAYYNYYLLKLIHAH